jgi:hypothetical protein
MPWPRISGRGGTAVSVFSSRDSSRFCLTKKRMHGKFGVASGSAYRVSPLQVSTRRERPRRRSLKGQHPGRGWLDRRVYLPCTQATACARRGTWHPERHPSVKQAPVRLTLRRLRTATLSGEKVRLHGLRPCKLPRSPELPRLTIEDLKPRSLRIGPHCR